MEELLHAGIHWALVNFAIFIGLLFFFLRKPVREFWASREGEIRFEVQEAERLSREASREHEELRRMLSRLDTDAKDLVDALEREGGMEKNQLMEEGKRRVERLKAESVRVLEQETLRARESLKEQTASLALETAEKMIRENIRPEDQKRLSEEYISGIAGIERRAAL